MLSVIRQSSYHANLQSLSSDFYDFREREDELAATLIAKSIKKLLRRAPSVAEKRSGSGASLSSIQDDQTLPSNSSTKKLIQESEGRLFHSDSSLSSTSSSNSSSSAFSSSSSLNSEAMKKRRKRKEKNVEVLLPNDMMTRLVRDIVRMAEGEPQGIRGCQLSVEIIEFETRDILPVGKINCDPKIGPTCQLKVRLTMIPPPPEATGSTVLLSRLLGNPSHNIYIKPGYLIEKKKLTS